MNGLTLNFPNYVQYAEFPGISIGIEYRRMLNKRGKVSASLSFTQLLWAGTPETGEYYANGYRADIGATLFGPGFNYYPLGSGGRASIELGGLLLIGSLRRLNLYQPNRNYSVQYSTTDITLFAAPQAHLGISVYGYGHFLFTVYGDFGPIMAADSLSNGNYGVIGMRIGRRF